MPLMIISFCRTPTRISLAFCSISSSGSIFLGWQGVFALLPSSSSSSGCGLQVFRHQFYEFFFYDYEFAFFSYVLSLEILAYVYMFVLLSPQLYVGPVDVGRMGAMAEGQAELNIVLVGAMSEGQAELNCMLSTGTLEGQAELNIVLSTGTLEGQAELNWEMMLLRPQVLLRGSRFLD